MMACKSVLIVAILMVSTVQETESQSCRPSPCGPHSMCRFLNNQAVCTCNANAIGSPPNCRLECSNNDQCPLNRVCQWGNTCLDPCLRSCGRNAKCEVIDHKPICSCSEGDTGNPLVKCNRLNVPVSRNEVKNLYTNDGGYSQYFLLKENMAEGNTLRFSVRTSSNAHILLASLPRTDEPVYEIVLGAENNTINFIQGRYPCYDEPISAIRTVNLLSQQEFRNFWIRLKAGARNTSITIQVGIEEEETPFQEWRDPKPFTPKYLSFRSKTWTHWKYGYSDKGNTVGVSKNKRQSVVTVTKSGSGYGQYYPLSEIVSHSENSAVMLYFTVRSSEEFQILLSATASSYGDRYEFGLKKLNAYMRRLWTDTVRPPYFQSYTEDGLLDERQSLRYWIKLTRDGQAMIGKGDSVEPILFWHDPNPIVPKFISFGLLRLSDKDLDPNRYADIQFALGPDYVLDSQDCKPRWKNVSDHQLPPDAVRGGYNKKEELFICRANHNGNWLPGNFVSEKDGKGQCEVTFNIVAHKKSDFQILTGCRFTWIPASAGEIPENAVLASETTGNLIVYISRVMHKSQLIVGKLQSGEHVAYAAFDSQELPFTDYEVMVNSVTN